VKNLINAVINFFYPYFRRFMPLQTFKYAACGGGNTLLDISLYFISIHYLFKEPLVHTPIGLTIKQHVAAILTSFFVTFPLGFYMSRTIVFPGSTLRGRIQLFRYFLMVMICFGLNYVFIRLFVEQCHLYPTVSKILTTFIVVAFSFITQRNFTFKVESAEEDAMLQAEAVMEAEAVVEVEAAREENTPARQQGVKM
jgi:putative flippase GtrA